jgi:hypothetical protein
MDQSYGVNSLSEAAINGMIAHRLRSIQVVTEKALSHSRTAGAGGSATRAIGNKQCPRTADCILLGFSHVWRPSAGGF